MRFKLMFMLMVILIIISCSNLNKSWYRTNSCSDLNLIPLIKPYKLFTNGDGSGYLDWSMSFINNGKLDECEFNSEDQTCVTRINVKKDLIYGYCDDYSKYFVIVPSRKIERKFSNKNEWLNYLTEIHQDTVGLYDPALLYNLYNNGSTARHGSNYGHFEALPWYNEIKEFIK